MKRDGSVEMAIGRDKAPATVELDPSRTETSHVESSGAMYHTIAWVALASTLFMVAVTPNSAADRAMKTVMIRMINR